MTLRTKVVIVTVALFFLFFAFTDRELTAYGVWRLTGSGTLALSISPSTSLAFAIGDHYFNAKGSGVYDLSKAQTYYEKTLELDPSQPLARYQLARIDFLKGHFDTALIKTNKQIELHGDNPQSTYYLRALIYGYSKQFKEAEKDFLKFIAWKPNSWAAHNDLAWVYFQQGEYQKSFAIAQEGLIHNPGNAWLLNSEGIALLNLGRFTEAAKILTEARLAAGNLHEEDWQRAYPGNDPRVASGALQKMREAIDLNLSLATLHK